MIKLFRKVRQNLILENKTGKYLKYAIGEIILVVFGILIALQINNVNEQRKSKTLLETYKQNVISELEKDLLDLSEIDSLNRMIEDSIESYIAYYNSANRDINILKIKADSTIVLARISIFNTSTYSIQDLFTTGNLKLFPTHQKNAIIKYKNSQDKIIYTSSKSSDIIINKFEEFEKDIDVLFYRGYSNKQHFEVKDWQYDVTSSQFRRQNNYIAGFLELYKYQRTVIERLKTETKELRDILKE